MKALRKATTSVFLPPLEDFLRMIEDWCKSTGVTKYQLAKLLEVDRAAVTCVFSGERRILYAEAEQISGYLIERLSPLPDVPIKSLSVRSSLLKSVQSAETVARAVSQLMKGNFTQLPVFNGDKYVGLTTDRMIVERLLHPNRAKFRGKWIDTLKETPLKDAGVIETSAVYPLDASIPSVANALRYFYAVMLAEDEHPRTIVTRWDYLKLLS